ncbi:NAD(P)H-dependent oxidoreductase [Salisediminibacterium halotolerans]|uniref:NAD(P)H-dependent oxidoreductase n=1 Tax=Salisediminibacterium halotolerans TaxID=517425 RepID=UPI000EB1D580|nr:NAD(P)H-dependent oxidoreductase [Salisediminibacterium halotolerans]RLJ74484.1 NAD(P)H dehydrogenase (quinone) [Actinophytocola xinjiangensis]RPE87423.1 NAD(P)H dehydrogenase (quinone) [Salisediminibacterium halotolerans]TWG35320.1 NAD(P)H dehydrogenase (quinone) [Salisediminibacterium halotolerans]GEL07952.1 NAD(P)H dehydrogenase [Salisediminibacterium halotolerans]
MKHSLILFMHPSAASFNRAICERIKSAQTDAGNSVDVRDVYQLSFDPVLTQKEYEESLEGIYPQDVMQEQAYIDAADEIVFVFPVWWGGFPASGKGYIDRVFSYGFAYELNGEKPLPKLNGKTASLVFTTGAPDSEWHNSGLHESMVHLIDASTLQFCGLKLTNTIHLGNVIQASDGERRQMLDDVYHAFYT